MFGSETRVIRIEENALLGPGAHRKQNYNLRLVLDSTI